MIDELGNDPQVIEAALGLVSAETNFNPFAVDVPFVCADPALPVNPELRGVTPLVDPAVTDADIANAASAQSLNAPFDAEGLSQAEVMIAQGFTSFTAVDAAGENTVLDGQDGGAGAGAGAGNGNGNDNDNGAGAGAGAGNGNGNGGDEDSGADNGNGNGNDNGNGNGHDNDSGADNGNDNGNGNGNGNDNDNGGNNNDAVEDGDQADEDADVGDDEEEDLAGCPAQPPAAGGDDQDDNEQDADDGADAGGNGGGQASGLDFGVCQPTIAFIGGLNGRPADEFTFVPQDPLVAEGQQEALNPNIITNRVCDQLINVCDASEEAIAACEDAQAEIEALGTRDQSTADTWNALLGFAGVDSSVQTV
jgi:hypothetical protein